MTFVEGLRPGVSFGGFSVGFVPLAVVDDDAGDFVSLSGVGFEPLPPGLFLEALLVALLAGSLAALTPAWRLWRETPARMLAHARAFA